MVMWYIVVLFILFPNLFHCLLLSPFPNQPLPSSPERPQGNGTDGCPGLTQHVDQGKHGLRQSRRRLRSALRTGVRSLGGDRDRSVPQPTGAATMGRDPRRRASDRWDEERKI